jgi:anti-sigma B factor antagonist
MSHHPNHGFAARTSRHNGAWRLALSGELDLATMGELARAVDGGGAIDGRPVVLDVSGLTFVDVSGVRALIDACERLTGAGHDVTVAGVDAALGRLLEIIQADRRLPLEA